MLHRLLLPRSTLAPSLSCRRDLTWQVSAQYVANGRGPVVAGAKFIGGSDDYGKLWATAGGFEKTFAHDFESVRVDRRRRGLAIDQGVAEATAQRCRGRNVVLFVTAERV